MTLTNRFIVTNSFAKTQPGEWSHRASGLRIHTKKTGYGLRISAAST